VESLEAHQKSSRAHLRAAAHGLRNTGIDDMNVNIYKDKSNAVPIPGFNSSIY